MMVVRNHKADTTAETRTSDHRSEDAAIRLQNILQRNWQSGIGGTYAVCSAHPAVIEAAIQQALADGLLLHVESTSSQVNQFGGYTGSKPGQFAQWVRTAAMSAGLPASRVLLGGDHLGPFPWRKEASRSALEKAGNLVRDCVVAGYQKIHLDASMTCADDPKPGISERVIAARAAMLCRVAEDAHRELPSGSTRPVYVIGTEVPVPGGELDDAGAIAITKASDVHRTLEVFRLAFSELGLQSAWDRVVALVVQPGVDFGSNAVFDYDRTKASSLSDAITAHPGIVFEAHSTDYQSSEALAQMVQDHFAILKVGPWLTFAYREAVLALSAIERELFRNPSGRRVSQVREVLEETMLRDPSHWRSYYHGTEEDVSRDRIYGYSDRCRYYWNQPAVQEEVAQLLQNVGAIPIPLTLISQYMPHQYEAIRAGELPVVPKLMIQHHVRRVLRMYAEACTVPRSA